jgi:hypothetical protein
MMIKPITTKNDEITNEDAAMTVKTKDGKTKKVNTLLGKYDPNQVRHKVFVDTDPRVWDVVYLQLANAGVSQETINEVYDDVRGGTPRLDPNPLALHLLARYKLTELNSSDDATAALETLSDAFDVIGNHGEFPHNPSLETLEDTNPDAFQSLGILSLFAPSISQAVQTTDTDDKDRLMAAANMATKCVNAEVPLTDDNIKQIEGTLTGGIEVARGAGMPNKATSTPGGLPPVSNSSEADLDLSDITPKSRKITHTKAAAPAPATPAPELKKSEQVAPAAPAPAAPVPEVEKAEPAASTPREGKAEPVEPAAPKVDKPAPAPAPAAPTTKSEPAASAPAVAKAAPVATAPKVEKSEPAATTPKVANPVPAASAPAAVKSEPVVSEPAASVPEVTIAEPSASSPTAEKSEPAASAPTVSAAPAAGADLSGIVIGEPEEIPAGETPTDEKTPASGDGMDGDMDEGALPLGTPASPARRINVPQRVLMEIYNHASSRDQITDALRHVEQDIMDNTPNAQFLVRFVPGVTQEIIKDILVNRTASGRYINRSTGRSGDAIPHTNLTGGSTYTAGTRTRALGPVEVPPGFAQENSSVLWDEPVITTMGYPFINFGAPEIYTILKDKDEKRVKQAYKKLKKQMKKVGLSDPIKVLKDFKNSVGVPCAINRLTIDSSDLLETGNTNVLATVYPRATSTMQAAIGTIPLTRDFIVEMYKVLSPTKGAKIYMDTLGMTEDEYADTLNTEGRPPIYIFIPKEKLRFKKAPAGFIARLFTSNKKPTLVEAKIGTHSGGFVMPFKTTRILFTEV